MNEKVDIEIFRRKLVVEMEGFNPLEINELAQRVHEKMTEIHNRNERIADSSKLAIMTALEFAAELHTAKEAHETQKRVLEHTIDRINLSLQTALSGAAKTKPGA